MKNLEKIYAKNILSLLKKHYPDAKMILQWSNNFELLVSIILSAQCTDLMVNKVTSKVFPEFKKEKARFEKNYKNYYSLKLTNEELVELVNFAHIPIYELEQYIKSTGFYRNKAKNIQAAANLILKKYNGLIPTTINELINIPGVGRKTANVFLGNAHNIYEGIAVDTHVKKQSKLLNFTKSINPYKIEQDLMRLFEKKDWFELTYLLIAHGRNMRKRKSDRITCPDKKCILCKTLFL